VRWLADRSPASVAAAVRAVAPQLADCAVAMSPDRAEDDPLWWSSTAVLGGRYVAKFAWSRPAAVRLAHEIGVLAALAGVPFRPEVVASGTDPLLLITRRVPGRSLFEVAHGLDPDRAGRGLAEFLAALHRPATRARVEAAVGSLPDARHGSQHPAPTRVLRDALGPSVAPWCDWVDATLAAPRPAVLVHADLHGDNQVWAGGDLRAVVDFETVSAAEPEYDLRALPGTGAGLLGATVRHYATMTGRQVAVDRVLAWHVRTMLGDALWRRSPVGELLVRFRQLGVDLRIATP
jgi:aminoglycoside phosphotransferase (APT) family kinase protein